MAKKTFDESEGIWRTIGGRRVFIRTGQSLEDAMAESGKFPSEKSRYKEADQYGKIPDEPNKALAKITASLNAEIEDKEYEVLEYGEGSMRHQNIVLEGEETTLSGGRRQYTDTVITVTSPKKVMGFINIDRYEKTGIGGGLSDYHKSSYRVEFIGLPSLLEELKKINRAG